LSFERAGIGATVKFEQALSSLVSYLTSPEGQVDARPDTAGLRLEIARRYAEIRVLYNLARYSASVTEPGYEASVNQLFGAELHQRLARTGAKAFGRLAELWQRADAPLGAAFTHLRLDSVAATFLGGTTEIQRNVIATRGLGLPRS
jgi:alkylation response protein AidB-like acyl-CoA dehydrogenase